MYQWTYETFDRLTDFDAGKSTTQPTERGRALKISTFLVPK
jgi:hypothetical protein